MIEASKENPQSYIMFIVFLTFWTTIAAPVTPVEIGGGCVFGPGTSLCVFVCVVCCVCVCGLWSRYSLFMWVCVCIYVHAYYCVLLSPPNTCVCVCVCAYIYGARFVARFPPAPPPLRLFPFQRLIQSEQA
jgi:hypothetical protein